MTKRKVMIGAALAGMIATATVANIAPAYAGDDATAEKNSCKGHEKDAKHSCKGKAGKAKNSCKGAKADAKNSCSGKNGCSAKTEEK